MLGAQSIQLKTNECVLVGGFESMSNIPFYLTKARTGYGYGHGQIIDGCLHDGLTDAFDGLHMGFCAEACASTHGFTREQQDAYALESFRRAKAATEGGLFSEEIVGVEVPQRSGPPKVISEDEQFKKLNASKVPTLKPAFKKDGTVTAANASALNDGACALILASASYAAKRGLTPIGRISGFADAARIAQEFPTAPALAIPKALKSVGLETKDIDYWEINEAFAVVALANAKLLGIDLDRLNVNGGAVALGHPIGASGARIVTTLLSVLKQKKAKRGVAAICNGGGGASSIIVERL
jgi:acetyl-CoA C-acetyltransferase